MSLAFEGGSQDAGLPVFLPRLRSPDYYTRPSVSEIAFRESAEEGYCCRVPDFVIGRVGYGKVKFFGTTDVSWLDLEKIVKFGRHSVVVYEDEGDKPPVGHGLNKAAQVSLFLKLKGVSEQQGARFVSFDPIKREWKFMVRHFSRFGLIDDDDDAEEEDVLMDETQLLSDANMEEPQANPPAAFSLSHSLPAHLGLDPLKMQEMRMLMFSGEDEREDLEASIAVDKGCWGKDNLLSDSPSSRARTSIHRSPSQASAQKMSPMRKAPVALLEYDANSSDRQLSGNILMNRQARGFPVRITKAEGFKLDAKQGTPLTGSYSANIVDAALLMGRSFRVGWGPNGILVHSGTPVGKPRNGLSSMIHFEKVTLDGAARDENGKVKEDLVDLFFVSPLKLHMSLDHEFKQIGSEPCDIRIQKIVADRFTLPEICRGFIEIVERQLDVPSLSASSRVILMHQVTVWELIRVLFSDRVVDGQSPPLIDPEEDDMALDKKDMSSDVDLAASHLIRRANFSYWLQESVRHRVQEDVSCLSGSNFLSHLLLLLTGRQLETAVELAASSGDVRLAILLSQAGGSMVNRSDVARQLDLWRINGLDFNFIENERLKLYELLSGHVQGAFHETKIDWKRYLGLVMWYHLPPDTSLSFIVHNYEQLVRTFCDLKTMFSAFSSTPDPLDYHMIWHYRAVLEAIGTFTSSDLHLLDLSLVSQLLSLGLCHWAIYVALHMSHSEDFPHVQASLVREILFRYCETWNTQAYKNSSLWILAIYFEYQGDLPAALDHFLDCRNWQKSHTVFMTSVAHSLFLSSKHAEIWRLAGIMEVHKAEIADWDLGAGIYIDFYTIKSFLQENTISELESLEEKDHACRSFFGRLKESLSAWGSRIPVDARAAYSKMAEELCRLLVSLPAEGSSPSVQMSCFETLLGAPTPEDLRSRQLQDALSVFTFILSEMAT
ncbi:unnamed protein product [Spirodela intermedia]|uniref:Peptidase S59 domain-containing protein n=1 Tax=Spirodela intermedia TaxID=51605 RepID=A0A7I8J459_SPIIN|nr:unnamed protein product [Spirodela intermedia]CAA6665046.1 unnamed protein product [Spirodela intermedia]